jgi:hypothetical protein
VKLDLASVTTSIVAPKAAPIGRVFPSRHSKACQCVGCEFARAREAKLRARPDWPAAPRVPTPLWHLAIKARRREQREARS